MSIQIQETKEKYGYHPDEFGTQSSRIVVVKCPKCSELRDIKRRSHVGDEQTCLKCRTNHRKQHLVTLNIPTPPNVLAKNGCNICYKNINGEFHISHVEPVSNENTVQGIVSSFALNNLGVAHPSCNLALGPTTINI